MQFGSDKENYTISPYFASFAGLLVSFFYQRSDVERMYKYLPPSQIFAKIFFVKL